VGKRLALWALANDYDKRIAYNGPMYNRHEIREGKVVVHFAHADSGLMAATKDGLDPPRETANAALALFELADKSGSWWPAQAMLDGQTVIVTSDKVSQPVAVRYAYRVSPEGCNLYNRDGLPASPFCSDPALLSYAPKLPQ
jgi:sialate O-acetylesterase